jgi:hypothetical protein
VVPAFDTAFHLTDQVGMALVVLGVVVDLISRRAPRAATAPR